MSNTYKDCKNPTFNVKKIKHKRSNPYKRTKYEYNEENV